MNLLLVSIHIEESSRAVPLASAMLASALKQSFSQDINWSKYNKSSELTKNIKSLKTPPSLFNISSSNSQLDVFCNPRWGCRGGVQKWQEGANFKEEVRKLSKDKNYYVYCRSGNRSGQAVRYMEGEGFTAFNLKGGVMSWPF